jgi:CYTH domain-containing protein
MRQVPEDTREVQGHRYKYARIERERRFLLSALPATPNAIRLRRIQDRYFIGTTLRLRKMSVLRDGGESHIYKLTQKISEDHAVPGQRLTTNTYLSATEYELLSQVPGSILTKTRHSIPPMGLDVFDTPLDGLVLGEAEFETDDAMSAFVPPSYVVAEVTHDVRFTGGQLVQTTREMLKALLTVYGLSLVPGDPAS